MTLPSISMEMQETWRQFQLVEPISLRATVETVAGHWSRQCRQQRQRLEGAEQRWRFPCSNLRVLGGREPPNRVRQRPGRGGCRPPSLESHQMEGNNVLPQSIRKKETKMTLIFLHQNMFFLKKCKKRTKMERNRHHSGDISSGYDL